MTITQHKADELFTKLVEAQAPVRPERLAEIQVAAESGWELAGDYIHLARAWLASQQALRDVIAENAALRKQIEELELKVMLLTTPNQPYEYKTEGSATTNLIEYTADNRTYDGEETA